MTTDEEPRGDENTLYGQGKIDGLKGNGREEWANMSYHEGYDHGAEERRRYKGEEEAYVLECLWMNTGDMTMKDARSFSVRYHNLYDIRKKEGQQ